MQYPASGLFFLFVAKEHYTARICHMLVNHSSVDGYLGSFYLLAAMNSFKNLHKNTCLGFCFQVFRA